ncbi:MAG: tRNA lysidine(34) synthetase TilS [Clostridia bacterium]|nr:tRNA lysidine(34) synthetase TilS [Clostridia bacterium]
MANAEKQIRQTICKHNLIEKGDHIVLGLSGGPDSVCLFHVLRGMTEEMDLHIHPVHVNHQFRPGAAEADQKYVETLCADAGLEARVFTVDCNALAKELDMTSEEAGRKARYDAFFQVAAEVEARCGETGSVKIAVGHNANDQAETVLFRILRGTGMDGIAGMAYAREERRESGIFTVVRPLLDTWREEVEAYCEEKGLHPVTDHTNQEGLYTRNRLRLDLIPRIEAHYNSNFQEGLVRMAKIAAADKDYFWEETARAYRMLRTPAGLTLSGEPGDEVMLDWRGLASCHEALRHRIILKAFDEIGLTQDITAERLEAADRILLGQVGGKTVEFPHGYTLSVGKGAVRFTK